MDKPKCNNCEFKSKAAKYLNKAELENLAKNCVSVDFNIGEVIFRQGALSSNIIYIKKGLVKVHIKGPYKEQIIKIAKAPKYLGLPTTFHENINQFSATAIEKTTACFIDLETFKQFVFKNGKFAYEIIVELCNNELLSFRQCVNRTQKQIRGRVAEALLFFCNDIYENERFIIPISREEFGNLIDTSRESVSRVLSEFNNEKLIEIEGRMVNILLPGKIDNISRNG